MVKCIPCSGVTVPQAGPHSPRLAEFPKRVRPGQTGLPLRRPGKLSLHDCIDDRSRSSCLNCLL